MIESKNDVKKLDDRFFGFFEILRKLYWDTYVVDTRQGGYNKENKKGVLRQFRLLTVGTWHWLHGRVLHSYCSLCSSHHRTSVGAARGLSTHFPPITIIIIIITLKLLYMGPPVVEHSLELDTYRPVPIDSSLRFSVAYLLFHNPLFGHFWPDPTNVQLEFYCILFVKVSSALLMGSTHAVKCLWMPFNKKRLQTSDSLSTVKCNSPSP